MSVGSVLECGLPFCGSIKEQTDFSRNFRITVVVAGIILLIAGIVLISSLFGNSNTVPGYVCAAIGLVALAIVSCMRCVKQDNIPYTPPKSDFLPYTPPKVEGPLPPSNTQSTQPIPSAPLARNSPVVIVKQPTQLMPKLAQFQEGLMACVGHLNQLQILLGQRGIFTQNIYDGNQLQSRLLTSLNNLSHPVEGPPNAALLTQWVSLIDVVTQAKSSLTSAAYSHLIPSEYKPPSIRYDYGGLRYNYGTYNYEYIAPSVEYEVPKTHGIQIPFQEVTCSVNVSKSLDLLHYWLAEGFYSCNLRNEAYNQIKQHDVNEIKEPFFFKLARDFYQAGDRLNTVKMLKEIYHYSNEKEDFFYRLAIDYYQEGDRDNAIKMIKETYHDTDRKENFFNKLAEEYYREGDREKAIRMIKETYHDTARKEKFFYRLAEDFYREGDRENAIKMIKEIYHDNEKKENFFFKLAEDYCQEGNKEMAAKMLKEISRNTSRKEAFMKEHNIFVF